MSPTNLKELQPRNRSARALRLRLLRASVLERRYHVDSGRVASGIIREARSGQESRQ